MSVITNMFTRSPKREEPAIDEFLVTSEPKFTDDEILRYAASGDANPTPSARSRVTGTSYSSTGSIPVDPGAAVELGSSVGGLTPERIPAFLSRTTAVRVYDQMANDDASVDVSLRAAKMPIMGATYFIQAYDSTPEALLIKQFIDYNLLRGQSAPFLLVLEDILRMYEYGFSVLEKVYELREWAPDTTGANRKKYTMLKELSPRPTPTIKNFTYDDNGGLISVFQNAVRADGKPEEVELIKSKVVIFTHNKKGGNLEGKSILRTAYKHWYYKDKLYTIDGIQKERHGMGFPVLTLPEGYTPADKAAGKQLVANIRTNEEAGAVLPPGFLLSFAEMKSQPVDVMRSVDHHNGMIMLNVMLQFITAGVSDVASGGRASSGSAQDMFQKTLRYMANLICEMINLYVIPQLVAYNFDTDKFPIMRVRNIGETKDLQQWASGVANLAARGLITLSEELENWVLEIIDAPFRSDQTPPVGSFVSGGGGAGQKGDVNVTNQDASGPTPDNVSP